LIAIIGKGFGVYGYLPALIELNKKVLVLNEYKNLLLKREELRKYIEVINFCKNEEELFERSNNVVLATTPLKQELYVKKIVNDYRHISTLYLEKPLCQNSKKSTNLLVYIRENGVKVCVDYNFLIAPWFYKIKELIENKSKSFEIEWCFAANYLKDNLKSWKSLDSEGGGIINFYGIHLIAVAAALKLNLISSKLILNFGKLSIWEAEFENQGTSLKVKISIESSENYFIVKETESSINIVKLINPFSEKSIDPKKLDPRIPILKKLILSNENSFFRNFDNLIEVNTMWETVIANSKII
jgi:hypothetical protein